jgi:predicted RNA-binding protein YlxR (DUF448 family)
LQQPKRTLVRVVRTSLGSVEVDPTGKRPGRGAYLCQRRSCWQEGLRKGSLARALKTSLEAADRAALEAYAAALPAAEAETDLGQRGAVEGSTEK